MKRIYLPGRRCSLLIVAALCSLFAVAAVAAADERVSESLQYSSGNRDERVPVQASRDTRPALPPGKPGARPASKSGSTTQSGVAGDFWFYDADVLLFADEDFDGFYSGIDLLFDADTIYDAVDVYAVAYLSFEGGPWEEYIVTEDFTIFGASGGDEYSVVTDLVSGYPPGSYDLLIELFDAWSGDFLAFIGPGDTSELSLLPLEDIAFDTPPGNTTVVINNESGGGATGLLSLAGLLLTALLVQAIRRRRPAGLTRGA